MTNQSTIDKLIEMHMTSMADAFRNQMQDISMKEIPFDDPVSYTHLTLPTKA